jgi:UDPglucose 6-dehydrogenase
MPQVKAQFAENGGDRLEKDVGVSSARRPRLAVPTQSNNVIGIMGLGVVGDAVRNYFERAGQETRVYDPYRGLGSEVSINEADVVFVCVPTPYLPERGFDDSALENAISLLTGSKTIVIKSTVLPGTTESLQSRYSQHKLLFNPEFLREAFARTDFLRPDRQVVGYTAQSRHLAESIVAMLPAAPYSVAINAREAEMAKYMTNAFLAMKVTFANEVYDLCEVMDIEYQNVRDAVTADLRIGDSHLDVHTDGYRGYGGSCLPKDTKALLELGERMQVPLRLLRAADRINESFSPRNDEPPVLRIVPRTDEEAAPLEEMLAEEAA